ncbi:hypothetical protein AB0H88_16005 [Nonomuraea sp. NPDC050680]|uniref:hypothetical protein n=1 Tax=Nonomuraea sp. NPDC050680 TaxID=3154630 RepID=UPI0034114D81
MSEETELVRRGYNELSYRYRGDEDDDGAYAPWLEELHSRLPPRGDGGHALFWARKPAG